MGSFRLGGEGDGFCSRFDGGDGLVFWGPEGSLAGYAGADCAGGEFVLRPGKVEFEAASCAEAFDGALGPGGGECGQEVDGSLVALEKKFGDRGGGAEVSVDLEDRSFAGGVGVEEIDVGAVLHEHGEGLPGFVAVEEAGPEGDGPGAAPSGVGSSVGEAAFEGDACCLCQLGSAAWGDLIAGVERVHVGHVALAGRGS